MFCISISYKKAGAEVRSRLAFSVDIQQRLLQKLLEEDNISQAVVLCTCCRTEVYFCGQDGAPEYVRRLLAEFSHISAEELTRYVMFFCDDAAAAHLFRVACGIESMVIGEDEILGQTKQAYALAKEYNAADYELNMVFQAAIACAKKIKTKTALSKTSVSTATLAANEAARLGERVNVLVIGASGSIGRTALKNLISHKNISVTATLRSHSHEIQLIAPGVRQVPFADRYKYIDAADCVISATSAPHYTVTCHELKKELITEKNRLFIDLAVPPDIDPCVAELSGARLIGIDYFEKLACENNALKLDSARAAKLIISQELDLLKKELVFHDFLGCLEKVKAAASQKTFEELLFRLKADCTAEQFSAVLDSLKKL